MSETERTKHIHRDTRRRAIAVAMFALWCAFVLFAAWHHVVWQDEVRALSLALQGDNVFAMLGGLRGEGHPAVWYLLLRATHGLLNRPEALQVAAFAVGAAAILLFVLRSPFGLPLIGLFLVTRLALFEYSVMARNYGITMLLLFLLAALYPRHRDRGLLLGVLLFLLANCNAYSVILAGAFALMWFVDVVREKGPQRSQLFRTFLLNMVPAGLGVIVFVLTVYPTYNDAAVVDSHITFRLLFRGIFMPAEAFTHVLPRMPQAAMERLSLFTFPYIGVMQLGLSLILFGSTLGLIRRPDCFLAAVTSLVGFSLFARMVFSGGYRHEGLWLIFLLSLYWIAHADREAATAPQKSLLSVAAKVGTALFVLLLALQVPRAIDTVVVDWAGLGTPWSRSRDLAVLIARTPELQDAVIVADPDDYLEALPYYVANRTYLLRERRFGKFAHFTQNARLRLSLDDIIADARTLRAETGKPVVILMHLQLDPSQPEQVHKEGYNWELVTSPEQVRRFRESTRLLKRLAPALSSESYDVYVLA